MRFIDMFCGMGTVRMGFEQAGHECVYSIEWDKHKRRIYEVIFGNEPEASDICTVRGTDLPISDCWCFGAPCQDFSIAGKRAGMQGDRSSLIREVFRLIDETPEEYRPEWLLYENVKGMLSSGPERRRRQGDKKSTWNGFDFLEILYQMASRGYDIEYELLNSKGFGVPQNRERVYTLGHKRTCKPTNIFPLGRTTYDGCEIEKVYWLSEGVSGNIGILFTSLSETTRQELPRKQMQVLLKDIQQDVETGKSREVESERPQILNISKGSIQEVEDINSWASCNDNAGGVCGVVQIPTEGLLLLWNGGIGTSSDNGFIQQQDFQTFDRQTGFIKRIRNGEFSTLLFAVQQYQGKLFYSIGDGRNWAKVYSKEVGKCQTTLSSILEPEVSEKYFLSPDKVTNILQSASQQKPQLLDV